MFQLVRERATRKLSADKKGDNDAPAEATSPAVEAKSPDALITSDNPEHPANLIPSLCAKFWTLGWVTGTGGGCSIREE